MKRRRVKITGIGFVTPAGIGREGFQRGILEHRSHVVAVKRFPEEAGAFVAAEVKRFNVSDYSEVPAAKRLPRHTQFALAATQLALTDAGLSHCAALGHDPVIVIGTSLMDSAVINKTIEDVTTKGPRHGLSRVVFQGPVAAIASEVAELIGGGRTMTLQSACCSGSDAIGHAAAMVAQGETDLAICGGSEAPIYYHPMLELRIANLAPATTERPQELCRPFDLWRTTGVIGEGAAVLLLEPETSPRPGYAWVSGYSFSSDTGLLVGGGQARAIELCLANAQMRQTEIEAISAWGPGHRTIDAAEATALWTVFGGGILEVPTVSIKGAIGNPFAAAGAIQAGCAALGLADSFMPPTVNWRHPDPECRLNLSAEPRYVPTRSVLVNSHGIAGTNSALVLTRIDR